MKRITIILVLCSFAIVSKAQLQKNIFVGLNFNPLYISGGAELTAKVTKGTGIFVRPTYNRRPYDRHTSPISYLDVPVGLKFVIVNEPSRGSAVPYVIDFSAGPFFGYALKGKYTPSFGAPVKNMTFGSDATNQLDVMDYGYFLNTQLNLGVFGFGVSAQVGTKQHDMSRVGLLATPTKQKSGTQMQITLNIYFSSKHKKEK